jgi:predicted alpha/beta-fold hydrolase
LEAFQPFFRNPHLVTIASNFWRRPNSERAFPVEAKLYQTEPEVRVLVHTQKPQAPRGDVIVIHGLEGSSQSGYAVSLAAAALDAGYAVHRFNMRSCGGTEHLALSNYHSGQTSDLLYVMREIKRASGLPLFAVGFSLGANVALKLAGELGEAGRDLLTGVCAVSAPIDLAACARALGEPRNFIYARRFLTRLKARVRRRHVQAPEMYSLDALKRVKSIWDFDDVYTGPLFGFGSAVNYYRTQSSSQYLEKIRVPALLVQAKDDPLIPFKVYDHPAFRENPWLRLEAVEHGGHVGFISRRAPRFWLDRVVVDWLEQVRNKEATVAVFT